MTTDKILTNTYDANITTTRYAYNINSVLTNNYHDFVLFREGIDIYPLVIHNV